MEYSQPDPRTAAPADRTTLILATLLVCVSLFLPRPANFAPIGAFGLFCGAHAGTRTAWGYPVAALTGYVVAIGGYHWLVLGSVILGFSIPAAMGRHWLAGRARWRRIGWSSLAASVVFFLISNLGSWIAFGTAQGETLVHHYARGVPYFWSTLAGDLFFSAVLFGSYRVVSRLRERTSHRAFPEGARPSRVQV